MTVPAPDVTFASLALSKLANVAGKRARAKQLGVNKHPRLQAFRVFIMQLAAFSCLTIAGFSLNITIGFVVAGLSFLVLSWLTTNTSTIENGSESTRDRLR